MKKTQKLLTALLLTAVLVGGFITNVVSAQTTTPISIVVVLPHPDIDPPQP